MNSRLKFLCSAVDACQYTTPVTSRYLCCELKRLSRCSGRDVKNIILDQSCESCGCYNSCNRRVKMIARRKQCYLRITCKLCGVTCKKTISRGPTRTTSQLINNAQHKIIPRSRCRLKAITLNRSRDRSIPVVSSPAVTLKQFLYNDS